MPVYNSTDADAFTAHGSRFLSFVRGDRGAATLCAWRLEIGPGIAGVPHRPSHEEVLLVLSGGATVTLDRAASRVVPGDVVQIPAGAELTIDAGPAGASAWVTTTRGLTAATADQVMRPRWAQ